MFIHKFLQRKKTRLYESSNVNELSVQVVLTKMSTDGLTLKVEVQFNRHLG
jgi:hypothetical protein